jgi:hypothetical protein
MSALITTISCNCLFSENKKEINYTGSLASPTP